MSNLKKLLLAVSAAFVLSSCASNDDEFEQLRDKRDAQFALLRARMDKVLPKDNPFCEALDRMDALQEFQRKWSKFPGNWGVQDEMFDLAATQIGTSVLLQKNDKIIGCKQPMDSYTALILANSIIAALPESQAAEHFRGEINVLLKDSERLKRYLAE